MRLWYRFCKGFCQLTLCSIHVGRVFHRHHVPLTGPALLVSNHQSFFDPMIVGYGLSREVDYMARDTLFRNALFGRLISSVNAFPVKRDEIDIAAIKETFRRLKAGRLVLLFPEATRTFDGKIREFKPGIALLARKAKVPVVPVVVDGAFECWPRNAILPRPMVPICAAFGQPFYPDEFMQYPPEEFVRLIHGRMIELQNRVRLQVGRKPYDYSVNENGNRSR